MLRYYLKKFQICENTTNIMPIYSAGFTVNICTTKKLYHILELISMKKRKNQMIRALIFYYTAKVEVSFVLLTAIFAAIAATVSDELPKSSFSASRFCSALK